MYKLIIISFIIIALLFTTQIKPTFWKNNVGWAMLTNYPWQRSLGYYKFSNYWQGTMRQLRFDPKDKVYSFDESIARAEHNDDYWQAGLLALHQGELDLAIDHFKQADRNDSTGKFWLAMAYFQRGKTNQCLSSANSLNLNHHSVACRLPVTANIHTANRDLVRAKTLFQELMLIDDQNPINRWLLNLATLMIEGNVDSVPKKWRAARTAIKSSSNKQLTEIKLTEDAQRLGINTFDAGKGVAVEDFDRDGDMDIVTGGFYGPTHFYRNESGKVFSDASNAFGLDTILGAHLITAADYDNDGWIDLFISHPTGTKAYGAYSLLRNEQGKHFVDVTLISGLLDSKTMINSAAFTWSSAWGDIDNDGDLDLFISNFGTKQLITNQPALDSALYRNDSGHFTDISNEVGLTSYLTNNLIIGAAFGDYNNDGFADLALASMLPGFPMLYTNHQGKRFEANEQLVTADNSGFTLSFADFNHDGRLDLLRGVAMLPVDNINGYLTAKPKSYGHTMIWIQKQDGQFRLSNDFFQNSYSMSSMGLGFGDLNNDGAYDFYLGTGGPQPWYLVPNVMYAGIVEGNQPNEQLLDITFNNPVGTLAKGHGIVFFDSDGDGDQDIYSSLGGMWPGDAWPNEFFVNHTQTNNSWIKLRLRGRTVNYYGLGAMLRVRAENQSGKSIERFYLMDNKTGFGSAPYLAHIGLGDSKRVTEVAVKWPGSISYKKYHAAINELTIIDQGDASQN